MAVMLTIPPPPRAFIIGTTSRAIRTTYIRFCSTALAHAVSSNPSTGPSGGAPSLLTRMSAPPNSRRTVSATRLQSSARRQSAWIGSTVAPVSSRMRAAAASRSVSRRALIATTAPSPASVRAMP